MIELKMTYQAKTVSLKKDYSGTGAISALIGIYENVVLEIAAITDEMSEDDFMKIFDTATADENCRSVQTIVSHIASAGYGYANYIRKAFSIQSRDFEKRLLTRREAVKELESVVNYTAASFQGKWEMCSQEISATIIEVHWGKTYDLEQLIEHAIVHVLRHERQIQRFLGRLSTEAKP